MTAEKELEEKEARKMKRRVFVREVAGKYAELLQQLLDQQRVYKSKLKPFKGGPTKFEKNIINPQEVTTAQAIETHILVMAPGQTGGKHGHMNSAVMYVLEGKGHEIHDGVRYDWQAGDAFIVGNARIHQHFNDSRTGGARLLIIKAKPLFIFFNLLHQKQVAFALSEPLPGFEDFKPTD